jgi:hypothetical protein
VRRLWFPLILVVIVGALVALFMLGNSGSSSSPDTKSQVKASPDGLPGLLTSNAPWDKNVGQLKDRLTALGLPALSAEGTVLHIHQHLDLYVSGQKTEIPQGIGIPDPSTFISDIHTHTADGVLHVESPTQQDFFLGQFFDVWGVKFDATTLGSYKSDATNKLQVYVNGQKLTTDPRKLKLEAHQEIVVAYGSDAQLPNPIPTSYSFPEGE